MDVLVLAPALIGHTKVWTKATAVISTNQSIITRVKPPLDRRVHQYHAEGCGLMGGYAPFCKHVFVPNFVGAQLGALPITDGNRHLLRSAYVKRRPEELAILARYAH